MRMLFLTAAASLAAIALPASAADAQAFAPAPGVSADFGVSVHRDGRVLDRRHRRGSGTTVVGGFGWSPGWALYNNRSFEPDSYNDWWHDRPDRAFPRWMQNNQDCARLWWSGGGWRC